MPSTSAVLLLYIMANFVIISDRYKVVAAADDNANKLDQVRAGARRGPLLTRSRMARDGIYRVATAALDHEDNGKFKSSISSDGKQRVHITNILE